MQDVLDLLPRSIADSLPAIELRIEQSIGGALGEYNPITRVLSLSFKSLSQTAKFSPNAPKETFWHELMHWIHLHGPEDYRQAIANHFANRTAGETIKQLPGYGSKGKRDKWWDAYAGRIYSWEKGVGIEIPTRYFQLFADPAKLIRQMDPLSNSNAGSFLETVKVVMQIFS